MKKSNDFCFRFQKDSFLNFEIYQKKAMKILPVLKSLEFKRILDESKRKRNSIKYEIEEKVTKSTQIKNLSEIVAKKSSLHGLASLCDRRLFLEVKLVWIIVGLLNWSYWLYQIYGFYQSYKTFKVITSFSQEIDTLMEFPG